MPNNELQQRDPLVGHPATTQEHRPKRLNSSQKRSGSGELIQRRPNRPGVGVSSPPTSGVPTGTPRRNSCLGHRQSDHSKGRN